MLRHKLILILMIASSTAFGENAKPAKSNTSTEGHKSVNLYFNPFGLIVGMTDVGADFAVSGPFSVGPEFISLNAETNQVFAKTRLSATGYGFKANWQFKQRTAISEGGLLTAYFLYMPSYSLKQTTNSNATFSSSTTASLMGLILGYRWMWDWFNIKLAGGLGYNTLPKTLALEDGSGGTSNYTTTGGVSFVGELSLGLAF